MTKRFRERIHRDKNDIRGLNSLLDRCGEEEVCVARFLDERAEPRFVDRQNAAIPGGNPRGVDVYNCDLVTRTLRGDHRHSWPTDIASPNAKDLFFENHGFYLRTDSSELPESRNDSSLKSRRQFSTNI